MGINSLDGGEQYQDLEPDVIAPLDVDIAEELNTVDHASDNEVLSNTYKSNNVGNEGNDQHMTQLDGEGITPTIKHVIETLKMKEDSILFDDLVVQQHSKTHQQDNIISKKEASDIFFNILTLATTECIDLSQEQSFGEIDITKNIPLLNRYIAT